MLSSDMIFEGYTICVGPSTGVNSTKNMEIGFTLMTSAHMGQELRQC